MEETFGVMLNEGVQWFLFFALIYFSFKNENVRILGTLVGGFCLIAPMVTYFLTSGLFHERTFIVGMIILAACLLGRHVDLKKKQRKGGRG
jgi:predicted membrane protein